MISTETMSHAEWEVMRIIWTLKECTSRQIIEALGDKQDWKPSTVKTFLKRLMQKNMIQTKKQGRGFLYSPNIMEMAAVDSVSEALFNDICAKDVGKELGNLIDQFEISKADIQILIDKLQQKAVTAPDKVKCDCISNDNMSMDC